MMNKIFLYKNCSIYVTVNKGMSSRHIEGERHQIFFASLGSNIENNYSICIELIQNKGGRICYGLLEASVISLPQCNKKEGCLSFFTCSTNQIPYLETNLNDKMNVYEGFPYEYLPYVQNACMEEIQREEKFPCCSISFDFAANHIIGSNSVTYAIVCTIILRMVKNEKNIEKNMQNENTFLDGFLYGLDFRI